MDAVPMSAGSRPRFLMLAVAVGLCLSVLAPAAPAHAATITVTTTTDEINADGDCSLREAIRAANLDTAVDACLPGSGADTIDLPAGRYTIQLFGQNEDAAATDDYDLTSDVTINGAGAETTIIEARQINGEGQGRVLDVHEPAQADIAKVTIRGGGGGFFSDPTIIEGAGIRNRGTLTLRDAVVRDNRLDFDDGSGVGIANSGTLTILDSSVEANVGGLGAGGIDNRGTLTLTRTTVRNNGTLGFGGAIQNAGTSSVTITDSTIDDNGASQAGGIFNFGAMSITDSSVSGNYTSGSFGSAHPAGGIENRGTLTLTRTVVNENRAKGGGGILNGGQLTVIDGTVSGNQGGGFGGGILNGGTATLRGTTVSANRADGDDFSGSGGEAGGIGNSGTLTLNNVTVANNTAADRETPSRGGGLFTTEEGTTTVSNTILAHNTASEDPDCNGTLLSQGFNLIQSPASCTVAGVTTGNRLNLDPRLGPLADNGGPTLTHALLAGSPAIDAGNLAAPGSAAPACDATDQRGVPRPQDGDGNGVARCDIGAFELQETAGCPPGAGAVAAYRYTIMRGSRTLQVADLTGRVQPGDRITVVATVAQGCTAVPIGLVSYQAQAPTYDPALAQVLFAQDARVVASGEHQLSVDVPTCYFQVDLIVGPVLARIGPPSDYYRQRQLDYATGGSSACPAFAPLGTAPSPSPAPPGAPGPASTHKTFVGLVTQ